MAVARISALFCCLTFVASSTVLGQQDAPKDDQPEVFKIDKQLITPDELKEFNSSRQTAYRNAMRSGDLQSRELISEAIRTQIFSLTLLKGMTDQEKEDGQKIVEALRRDIYSAGGANLPDAAKRAFREFLLKEVTDRCKDLLDAKVQFYPRMQAVIILGNLNLVEGDRTNPDVAYAPAIEPLIQALNEPGQLDSIKLAAVVGLTRINLHTPNPPPPPQRIKMAEGMIRELENPETHYWYQARLLEGLGSIDQVNDLTGKPFIVNAIQKVLRDRDRPWRARTAAAKALGRAQLTAEMDVNIYVIDVVNLAWEVAQAFNAENAPKSPFWSQCLFDIYCAFKPATKDEVARGAGLINKVNRSGMNKFTQVVNEGYGQYLPLFNHALKTNFENFPTQLIDPVRDWLQSNAPADYYKQVPPKQASDNSRQTTTTDVREN